MTKELMLSQGKFTLVDAEDFEYLNQWKWFLDNSGYASRNSRVSHGETRGNGNRYLIRLHYQLLSVPYGKYVDHISGDRLDNRRSNLRICTLSQNNRNTGIRADNTSGYKGVGRSRGKRWRARIMDNIIGYFDTPEEAARAYDREARRLFGEFARLNFSE